jgi:hypothetical protein
VGKVEVEEDRADDGGIGEEREDPHLAAACRAQERAKDEHGAPWYDHPGRL